MSTPEIRPLTDLLPAERDFLRLVRERGVPAPDAKTLNIQKPVADDGESDCWTHAWRVAQATAGTYVEGVCRRHGANGISMHAWVEADSPFGGRVLVECTPGYEDATHYFGIAVESAPGSPNDLDTKHWGDIRASIIQARLQAEWDKREGSTR